ncbi:two-component regulator propeller domain-containing protein [Sphingobacterium kyonggiense]|uniref:two-component regulator propeller domain-containing protein n=1 Tax=Sphingobacterium kyonggiense TaxID=714075 RepID=UPI003CD0704B
MDCEKVSELTKKISEKVYSLGEESIICIEEDNNGTIWYGTLDGVKRIIKQKFS